MFWSACIHCQRDLGRNQLIESLPIGRRIAFDAQAGRLWVICPSCSRWNLVPFESRYEAIEAGEKLFRDTTQRMSSGEIGLARTSEGTQLIRVGKPLRPEMAAWRYGRHFVRRRLTYAVTTGPAYVALWLAGQAGGLWMNTGMWQHTGALGSVAILGLPFAAVSIRHRYIDARTHTKLSIGSDVTHISRLMARQAIVDPSDGDEAHLWVPIIGSDIRDRAPFASEMSIFRLLIARLRGDRSGTQRLNAGAPSHFTRLTGCEAHRALRLLLPLLNESGASSSMVDEANAHITARNISTQRLLFGHPKSWDRRLRTDLASVYGPRRLALEMLVHEDSERRWLAGELLDLELEWRRANEIAEIADGLLRDPAIEASLSTLKARATE